MEEKEEVEEKDEDMEKEEEEEEKDKEEMEKEEEDRDILGQHDKNKSDPICVTTANVVKASTLLSAASSCRWQAVAGKLRLASCRWHFHTQKNFKVR